MHDITTLLSKLNFPVRNIAVDSDFWVGMTLNDGTHTQQELDIVQSRVYQLLTSLQLAKLVLIDDPDAPLEDRKKISGISFARQGRHLISFDKGKTDCIVADIEVVVRHFEDANPGWQKPELMIGRFTKE